MQVRLKPEYHFPVTLGFHEVKDILIPEKDYSGRETDFFKTFFAKGGSETVWKRFAAKLERNKIQAAGGGGGGGPGDAPVVAQPAAGVAVAAAPVVAVPAASAAAETTPQPAPAAEAVGAAGKEEPEDSRFSA